LKFEKSNDLSLIQLNDPKREYIREGSLSFLSSSYFTLDTRQNVILLLLDNCLVIINKNRNSMNYHIRGSPIPLSLLSLHYSDQKYSLSRNKDSTNDKNSSSFSTIGSNNTNTLTIRNYGHCMYALFNPTGYILTIRHIGHRSYHFYTSVYSEQRAWVKAIQSQLDRLPKPIAKEVCFFSYSKIENPLRSFCRLKDGTLLLCNDHGIYVLTEQSTLKLLIPLFRITQIIALEEFDILFILSNRNVYTYSLSLILKNVYTNVNNVKLNKPICNNISFISLGSCDGRFLLCCAKVSNKKTTIKIFEPRNFLINATYQKKNRDLYLIGEVVQLIRTFYIQCESHSIHFLRHSLCVACSRGFKILNINNLTGQNLLNLNDVSFENLLISKYLPMNMFKTKEDDFLLCYNKIGFFIDKNGGHSRPNILFNWYGEPKDFAYCSPYIYTFTSDYIAIWKESDPSVPQQVITGRDIKLQLSENSPDIVYSRISKGKQKLTAIKILSSNSYNASPSSPTLKSLYSSTEVNTKVIDSPSSVYQNTNGDTVANISFDENYKANNNSNNNIKNRRTSSIHSQNQIQNPNLSHSHNHSHNLSHSNNHNHNQIQNQKQTHSKRSSRILSSAPPRGVSNQSNVKSSQIYSIQNEHQLYSSPISSTSSVVPNNNKRYFNANSIASQGSSSNHNRMSSPKLLPSSHYVSTPSNHVNYKRLSTSNQMPIYHAVPPSNVIKPKRLSSANPNANPINSKRYSSPVPLSSYDSSATPVNSKRLSFPSSKSSFTSYSSAQSNQTQISSQSKRPSYIQMKSQNPSAFNSSSSRITNNVNSTPSMYSSNQSSNSSYIQYSNRSSFYSNPNYHIKLQPQQPYNYQKYR